MNFDHIALSVPAIAEAVKFYKSQFPHATVLHQDETWALIEIDGLKIAFVLEEHHPPHMAFRVDSREELTEAAARSHAAVKLHRDGSESFYYYDTCDNAIEVIFYPPKNV